MCVASHGGSNPPFKPRCLQHFSSPCPLSFVLVAPSHNKSHPPHTHQRLVLVLNSTLNCVFKVGHIWKHGHNKEEKQFFGRLTELCTSSSCGLLLSVTACFLHEERGWGWGGIDRAISNVKKPIAAIVLCVWGSEASLVHLRQAWRSTDWLTDFPCFSRFHTFHLKLEYSWQREH